MSSAGDKAKATASSLFGKTKTFTARATQKVMVKFGKAEETVDIQFNQEAERFFNHSKAVKKIKKDTIKLLEITRDLSISQSTLADGLYSMYETKAQNYNATVKGQDISKSIDQSRLIFDEVMRKDFLDPMSKYLGQFKEAKMRIAERNTRLVDMDRYGRDLKILQEKAAPSAKIQIAEQKYEAAATNYHNLNDELLKDLPRLYEDRIPFFDPLIATYGISLADYYKHSATSTAEIIGMVSRIDRQSIHNHQRVMTIAESSSTAFKATIGSGSSSSSSRSHEDGSEYVNASAPPSAPPSVPPPSAPLKAAPPRALPQAKGVYDFNPSEANELGFKVGDIITIHSMKGDWWEGEFRGKRGLLPSNYVQLLQ